MDSFYELCKKDIPPIRSSNNFKIGFKLLVHACWNKTAWTKNRGVYVVEILFDATAEIQMGKALKGGFFYFFFCFLRLEMDQNLKQNCWCCLVMLPSKNYRLVSLQLGSSTSDALWKTYLPITYTDIIINLPWVSQNFCSHISINIISLTLFIYVTGKIVYKYVITLQHKPLEACDRNRTGSRILSHSLTEFLQKPQWLWDIKVFDVFVSQLRALKYKPKQFKTMSSIWINSATI